MVVEEFEFEWDLWNANKNVNKHGVLPIEVESVFYDEDKKILSDIKHSSSQEVRYLLYGKSMESRILTVAFTLREGKIRVITARSSSKKEREFYEVQKAKK